MIKEFAWDKNNVSEVDPVSIVHLLIDKDIVRESISKMKGGKAARPP